MRIWSQVGRLGQESEFPKYPEVTKSNLDILGKDIHLIAESSYSLPAEKQSEVLDMAGRLSRRLVNEVVIPEGTISIDEANKRLDAVHTEVFRLKQVLGSYGGKLGPAPSVPTTTGAAAISLADAKALYEKWTQAYPMFGDFLPRLQKLGPVIEKATQLPLIGPGFVTVKSDLNDRWNWLNKRLFETKSIFDEFPKFIQKAEKDRSPYISIERKTYDWMRLWIGNAFTLNEKIAKLEGFFFKKPAEEPPPVVPLPAVTGPIVQAGMFSKGAMPYILVGGLAIGLVIYFMNQRQADNA